MKPTSGGLGARDGTFIDFGGEGISLLFLHANGYPPACYRPLLATLASRYHVLAAPLRPLWSGADPQQLDDWRILSTDLERSMESQLRGPIVVAGHSLGATVALRAALHQGGRFSALILMDPVIFPRHVMLFWNLARKLRFASRLQPLIRRAQNRRATFNDLEAVFRSYRARPVFRHLSDANLRTYISGIVEPSRVGRYRLVYPPEWEARIYYTAGRNDWDLWQRMAELGVPTLIIRGSESDTFWKSTATALAKRNSGIRITEIEEASHLVPLERPMETARACEAFLGKLRNDG
jgi:pimeloyl-ACP methyl ester carboxylesterase